MNRQYKTMVRLGVCVLLVFAGRRAGANESCLSSEYQGAAQEALGSCSFVFDAPQGVEAVSRYWGYGCTRNFKAWPKEINPFTWEGPYWLLEVASYRNAFVDSNPFRKVGDRWEYAGWIPRGMKGSVNLEKRKTKTIREASGTLYVGEAVLAHRWPSGSLEKNVNVAILREAAGFKAQIAVQFNSDVPPKVRESLTGKLIELVRSVRLEQEQWCDLERRWKDKPIESLFEEASRLSGDRFVELVDLLIERLKNDPSGIGKIRGYLNAADPLVCLFAQTLLDQAGARKDEYEAVLARLDAPPGKYAGSAPPPGEMLAYLKEKSKGNLCEMLALHLVKERWPAWAESTIVLGCKEHPSPAAVGALLWFAIRTGNDAARTDAIEAVRSAHNPRIGEVYQYEAERAKREGVKIPSSVVAVGTTEKR